MIIKVKKNEYFPADMLLLNSSEPRGICYIETKTLDGETNLKHKQSIKQLAAITNTEEDFAAFKAFVQCDKPNELIYQFGGVITVEASCNTTTDSNKLRFPLSYDNFLLRGASLKSTDFIYGIAVFTGHDSKIMRNGSVVRTKMSKVEKMLQR